MPQRSKLGFVAGLVIARDELLPCLKAALLRGNQPMSPTPFRVRDDRRDAIRRDDEPVLPQFPRLGERACGQHLPSPL
jgi:hypothetical protein